MTTSTINVKILAELLGVPSLKKGETAVGQLEASFNKLGKTIGLTLGGAELVKFGKDSVAAFAADQASAASLNKTLQNLGQGFADLNVEGFIKKTEMLTGVVDEKLRPAFETLVRATGDFKSAQDLLTLSLDVSAGSGKDLGSVSSAISKAYLGQTTALSKLGVGLTAAQLKGKSFVDIQKQLNTLFGGQAAVFADTYAGKIQKLGTAWDNVKEIIGKGVVDAFSTIAKNQNVDNFTTKMEATATAVADIARGIAQVGSAINNLPVASPLFKLASIAYKNSLLGWLQSLGAKQRLSNPVGDPNAIVPYKSGLMSGADNAAKIAQDAKDLTALQKSNAEKAKQLKLDTAIAMLKKSQSVFDQQKIQIAAALQNKKLTEDEKNRLALMQTQADLQQAIDDKNTNVLDDLMNKIKGLQDSLVALQKVSVGNPFDTATQGAIALQSALYGLNAQLQATRSTNPLGGGYDLSNYAGGVPSVPSAPAMSGGTTTVNLTLDGQIVQQVIVDNTASGSPSTYARNLGSPLRDSW